MHRTQTRKGNDIPYIAHLMAVAATVLEWGGDEDAAIAALLHDAVEDQGGMTTEAAIRARYGDRVADIVLACTDSISTDPTAKAPWEERKRAHVAKLASAGADVALVTAADKLHNATAMIRDVRRYGPETLRQFNGKPDRLVWYFRAIADALALHEPVAPLAELREAADTLHTLAVLGAGDGRA